MKQKTISHKFIYKLSSKRLRQAKWNLSLPLSTAVKNKNDIVALNDSQILRWICELNGITDLDSETARLKSEIKSVRKQPHSKENQAKMRELYRQLYALQFQKDYFCMIMESEKDYDTANQVFCINGYKYHRLLGTNGGIKKSTITYVGDKVFHEIVKRILFHVPIHCVHSMEDSYET